MAATASRRVVYFRNDFSGRFKLARLIYTAADGRRNRTRGEEAAFFETPGRYPLASSLFLLSFFPSSSPPFRLLSPIGSNKACPLAMSNRTKTNIDRRQTLFHGQRSVDVLDKTVCLPTLPLSLSLSRLARVKITITVDIHGRTPITRPVSIIRAGWRANEQLNGNQTRPPNP